MLRATVSITRPKGSGEGWFLNEHRQKYEAVVMHLPHTNCIRARDRLALGIAAEHTKLICVAHNQTPFLREVFASHVSNDAGHTASVVP